MDDAILRSDLTILETLDEQIMHIEEKIAALAVEDRHVRLLMTMMGVGYFTAMLVPTKVGDIGRFHGDKAFASWMGTHGALVRGKGLGLVESPVVRDLRT